MQTNVKQSQVLSCFQQHSLYQYTLTPSSVTQDIVIVLYRAGQKYFMAFFYDSTTEEKNACQEISSEIAWVSLVFFLSRNWILLNEYILLKLSTLSKWCLQFRRYLRTILFIVTDLRLRFAASWRFSFKLKIASFFSWSEWRERYSGICVLIMPAWTREPRDLPNLVSWGLEIVLVKHIKIITMAAKLRVFDILEQRNNTP